MKNFLLGVSLFLITTLALAYNPPGYNPPGTNGTVTNPPGYNPPGTGAARVHPRYNPPGTNGTRLNPPGSTGNRVYRRARY